MHKAHTRHLFSTAAAALLIISLVFIPVLSITNTAYATNTGTGIQQYTIKWGDSLYSISKSFGTTVDALKKANNLASDLIMAGQVINIPSKVVANNLYTVKSGDSLYLVSRAYGVTTSELKAANNLGSDMIKPGQVLVIPSSLLKNILAGKGINTTTASFSILVDKSDHILILSANGIQLKSYHVELGDGGPGDKERAGDHRTPEGNFIICQKSVLSPADQYLGTRWMRLSYPNIEDASRGLQQGLIDRQTYDSIVSANRNGTIPPQYTSLGGGVGIHGGSTPKLGSDWTWGCVGLRNSDVEEYYNYIKVGTPVVIQK